MPIYNPQRSEIIMPTISSSAGKSDSGPAESQSHRSYFYVGGQYVDDDRGDAQHLLTGQMYVEQLLPVGGVKHPWPLVFIHGAGQTGTVSLILLCVCGLLWDHRLA